MKGMEWHLGRQSREKADCHGPWPGHVAGWRNEVVGPGRHRVTAGATSDLLSCKSPCLGTAGHQAVCAQIMATRVTEHQYMGYPRM